MMLFLRMDLFLAVALLSILARSSFGDNRDICRKTCGNQMVEYPFGIDEGCGDPLHRLECVNGNNLSIWIVSEFAPITINYSRQEITINTTTVVDTAVGGRTCHVPLNESAYNVEEDTSLIVCLWGPNVPADAFLSEYTLGPCLLERKNEAPGWPLLTCYSYTLKEANPANPQYTAPPGIPATGLSYANIPWIASPFQNECSGCDDSGGICGYNASRGFLCICSNGNTTTSCEGNVTPASAPEAQGSSSKSSKTGAIIGGVAGGVGGLAALLLIGCCCLKRRRKGQRRILDGQTSSDSQFLTGAARSLPQHTNSDGSRSNSTRFSLKELQDATNGFSESGRLGDGGFGTVYKGRLQDGRVVAVKKLNPWNTQGQHQFDMEVTILSQVTHPHLVRLYGSCYEGRELLLVYEFVANGTLADHLHDGGCFLDWETRLNVAAQTAKALAFLHTDVSPPIYHRDVKSTNILLDERYHAKVGDFGLSRLVPSLDLTHVTTAPQGTPGYVDPDYHQSYQLTDKSDVYSLGVVLMEIVSAQRAVDLSRDRKEINLAALAVARIQRGELDQLVDPRLGTQHDTVRWAMVQSVAELGFRCLAPEKEDRPCMKEVADQLQAILNDGKRMYVEQMGSMHNSSNNWAAKSGGGGGAPAADVAVVVDSPTSVQMKWASNSTSPNDSTSSL